MDYKVLTARISRELHKKLKIRLAEEETSFQEVIIKLLKEYLNEPPSENQEEPPEVMKTREAAAVLGVSERTLQRKIKAGTLKASKPGKDYLIPIEEVERLKKEEGE